VRASTGRSTRSTPHRSSRGRGAAASSVQGSRERLFAAAATEFAARGFAGANVDRIARAAAVNKAMIYYHFRSKAALYQEVLGDMFQASAAEMHRIAASDATPEDKLKRFVEGIAVEAEARPHFPAIWFREIAEGGIHLSDRTLADIASIVQTLVGILQDGARAGRFTPINPFLVHGGIVGPILLFFASGPLRQKLERVGMSGATKLTRDDVVAHVQRVTLGVLEGKM
jgi:AcrR family transcriptional regulator